MKRKLEALVAVLAISANGCATTTNNLSSFPPTTDGKSLDQEYDSVDDLLRPEDVRRLADSNYMVISESKYQDSEGKEKMVHSIGTAVVYKNIGSKSYLATANHVVENEEALFSFYNGQINKLEKVSEQFYLLEDDEVGIVHVRGHLLLDVKQRHDVEG